MSGLITGFGVAATWLRGQAWRQPDSRADELFASTPFTELVVAAEASGYDFAFRPDAAHLELAHVATSPGHLSIDPFMQLTLLATATKRIGLVGTVSATFADPFTVARQLVTLEHVAGPRVGWNLVTSLAGDGNHAPTRAERSEERWERAAEFVEVVEGLRAAFPADAVLDDRATGRFLDADRIRPLAHHGTHFAVRGPLPLPAGSGDRLPILQAGGSTAGVRFATRHAAGVFALAPRAADAVQAREALHARGPLQHDGPAPGLYAGISLFLAPTRDEAWRLFHAARGDSDEPLRHWTVVGTVQDAVDAIEWRWTHDAIDGVIVFPGGSWDSAMRAALELVPALAARGIATPGPSAWTAVPFD